MHHRLQFMTECWHHIYFDYCYCWAGSQKR